MKNTCRIDLAMDLLKIIFKMAEMEEDYSLIMREYNDLIEEYELPLLKMKWISTTEFDFVTKEVK